MEVINSDEYFEQRNQANLKQFIDFDKDKPPLVDICLWQCQSDDFRKGVAALDRFIGNLEESITGGMVDEHPTIATITHRPYISAAYTEIDEGFNQPKRKFYEECEPKNMFMLMLAAQKLVGALNGMVNPKEWQPKEKVRFEIEYDPSNEGKKTKFRIYTVEEKETQN